MTSAQYLALATTTALLFITACTSTPAGTALDPGAGARSVSTISHEGPVRDLVSLIDHLRSSGLTVTPGKPISQPFFSVQGQQTTVGTETIQIYEYADTQSMEADASKVSHDGGSVGTSMMSWAGLPHFFKKGRILVLYIGSDKQTLDALTLTMGQQFAGR